MPNILRMSERQVSLICGAVGIVIGIIFSIILSSFGVKSMAGQVFNLKSGTCAIPVGIMCMFCWGLLICTFRLLRLKSLERLIPEEHLDQALAALLNEGVQPQFDLLKNQDLCDYHPFYRRLRAVLDQWVQKPSFQSADIVLQNNEMIDSENVHGGYTLVRTFIWAMPVLGLIGTVIGISLAVGGFASFLGGSVEDVTKIKTSLVGVTSGLSFAFLITLEGLLGALLTMLPTTSLQSREQAFYGKIQRFMTDRYMPTLAKVMPEGDTKVSQVDGPSGEVLKVWQDAMRDITSEAVKSIQNTSKAVLGELSAFRESQRVDMEVWVTSLNQMIRSVADQNLKGTDEFIAKIEILRDVIVKDREEFQTAEREAWRIQGTQHNALIAALNAQQQGLGQTTDAIGELSRMSADALKSQEVVLRSIEQVSQLNVADLSAVIDGYSRTLSEARLSATDCSRNLEEVLAAQKSLQDAIVQLRDINFMSTIGELRDVMARITPLLKMLSKPQIVLMPTGGDE